MGWLIAFIVIAAVGGGVVAWIAVERRRNVRDVVDSGKRSSDRPVARGRAAAADHAEPAPRPADSGRGPARRSGRQFGLRWFGPGDELEVGGFVLANPCVYASAGARSGYRWATDPSEILLDAEIRRSDRPAGEMGYWPWYERIEPENRFEYLSWIASGRSMLPRLEGYLFLYFYGIERRLLVDEEDRAWALKEVVRLRKLDEPRAGSGEGRSFRLYSTGLLWFEIARTPDRFDDKAFERVLNLTSHWTPDLMTAPLAWLASRERPLPASMARQIASNDPAAQRSVVTKRIPEEFDDLFATRYRETFGAEGMALRVSKRDAWHTYRPASGGLEEVRVKVPNPMGIRSQFKKLPGIWNSCVADLRKLSRVSSSLDGEALTVEAWEAMPEELRADVDHPLADAVAEILVSASSVSPTPVEDEDHEQAVTTITTAGRFAALLDIERRPTLTATQSRRIATTLSHAGYGIVPDARVTPVRYGWDEPVAVIPAGDEEVIDSARYNAAACVLRLGLSVALADGHADEAELRVLTDHVDSVFDLSPEEQQRVAALRDLLVATGADIKPIARKIREMLSEEARRTVGRLLVVIAAASDGIDREERMALRKAFRTLDLAPEILEAAISEVAPEASEEEVAVKAARPTVREGEAIPTPPASSGFRLNHAAISDIMAETREVSLMLAEAMGAADGEGGGEAGADEATEPIPPTPESLGMTGAERGPGGRYQALFETLIGRERWARQEAGEVARSHGIMLDAGIETINDWAFEALGGPLVEDEGDELAIDRALLETE